MSSLPSYLHRNGTTTLRHRTVMRPIASQPPLSPMSSEDSSSSADVTNNTVSPAIIQCSVGDPGVADVTPLTPSDTNIVSSVVCHSACSKKCTQRLHLERAASAPTLLTPDLLNKTSVNPQQ